MRRCLDFHGRARRLEFLEFAAGWLLITMVAAAIDHMRAESDPQADNLFTSLVALIHMLPFCAVAARRSHDLNRTGWLCSASCRFSVWPCCWYGACRARPVQTDMGRSRIQNRARHLHSPSVPTRHDDMQVALRQKSWSAHLRRINH
ncbi:DUF805 domain-containing protein [Lichenibacterium ramalinae]|nr:DUF805 domain-containing protein [Lichenibacterium ramalinae]